MPISPQKNEENVSDLDIARRRLESNASGLVAVAKRAASKADRNKNEPTEVSAIRADNRRLIEDEKQGQAVGGESPEIDGPESIEDIKTDRDEDTSTRQHVNTATEDKLDLVTFNTKILRHHDEVLGRASRAMSKILGCKVKNTNLARGFAEMIEHVVPLLERMAEKQTTNHNLRPSNNKPDGIMELDRNCGVLLQQVARNSKAME